MNNNLSEQGIQRIERVLDCWIKTRITRNNFNGAAFKILGIAVWGDQEFPKCGATFNLEDGYQEVAGRFRVSDKERINFADAIVLIKEETIRVRLWKKFLAVVEKLYKVLNHNYILSQAGHLELYLKECERSIKSADRQFLGSYADDLSALAYVFIKHRNKLALMNNPELLRQKVEELIIQTIEQMPPEDRSKNLWEFRDCVELFIFHGKPIPTILIEAAEKMLKGDQEKLKEEKRHYEQRTKKLNEHIKILKYSTPTG